MAGSNRFVSLTYLLESTRQVQQLTLHITFISPQTNETYSHPQSCPTRATSSGIRAPHLNKPRTNASRLSKPSLPFTTTLQTSHRKPLPSPPHPTPINPLLKPQSQPPAPSYASQTPLSSYPPPPQPYSSPTKPSSEPYTASPPDSCDVYSSSPSCSP